MNKITNLPNRRERRKAAKDLGLLGKKKDSGEKNESKERSKAIGNLIRLRNLTEQRNSNKTKD
jgi:hypothetical protein